MTTKTADLRVRRTVTKIDNRFKELIASDGYDKITILSMLETGNFSRSAFYSHYKDLNELYRRHVFLYFSEFSFFFDSQIYHELSSMSNQEEYNVLVKRLSKILRKIKNNIDYYVGLIEAGDGSLFNETLTSLINREEVNEIESYVLEKRHLRFPLSVVVDISIHATTSILRWWLIKEPKISEKVISEMMLEILISLPYKSNYEFNI